MIKKLKKKFIVLATVAMFGLMGVLVLIMNLFNYSSVVRESDSVLDMLSENLPFNEGKLPPDEVIKSMDDFVPHGMSPEVPYESRFFLVMISPEGSVISSDLSRIVSVDSDSITGYIEKAAYSSNERGFADNFRYRKTPTNLGLQILFLDCGRKLDSFRLFMWTSIAVGVLGCVIVFLAFLFLSGRIVRPIAESYEKQKRFITDAGHEIKTPLTIINANLDLLEADGVEKEELTDIRQQTDRLKSLTQDLVFLSKMEEERPAAKKIEFPVSDLVSETANSFSSLALYRNIGLDIKVEPNISLSGYPDAFRQLVSILLDNAIKYSPDQSTVSVSMESYKKSLVLSVVNQSIYPVSQDELARLFDRFYRTDTSRNSESGGHGIGLSIAKAVVDAHGGKIQALSQSEKDFRIVVNLPL